MIYKLAALFLLLGLSFGQDLLNEGKCDILHKYATCPSDFCCVRDEFFRQIKYCKKIGVLGDSCSTVLTDSDCPCARGLYCKPNIYSPHFTSIYGTCVVDPRVTTTSTMTMPTKATMTMTTQGKMTMTSKGTMPTTAARSTMETGGHSTDKNEQTNSHETAKPMVDGTTMMMATQTSTADS